VKPEGRAGRTDGHSGSSKSPTFTNYLYVSSPRPPYTSALSPLRDILIMPPRTYAQAASRPLIPVTFHYIAEKPETTERLSMPSRTIPVSGGAFSTSAGAQQCFDKDDRALLPISTSGEIDEYHVLSVDENGVHFEHQLSFVEVCQPHHPCNVI